MAAKARRKKRKTPKMSRRRHTLCKIFNFLQWKEERSSGLVDLQSLSSLFIFPLPSNLHHIQKPNSPVACSSKETHRGSSSHHPSTLIAAKNSSARITNKKIERPSPSQKLPSPIEEGRNEPCLMIKEEAGREETVVSTLAVLPD